LFTTVLNQRIVSFCENDNVISDALFGLRKGLSTVDAVFILMNVQRCLSNNNRLYCDFVDMCKCFDTLYRDGLWLKLFKCGIQGKILRIIKTCIRK